MIFHRFWYNLEGHTCNMQTLFQLFIHTHVHSAPNHKEFLRNPIGILLESQAFKCSKNLCYLCGSATILQVRWLYYMAACNFAPNHEYIHAQIRSAHNHVYSLGFEASELGINDFP